MGVSSLAELGLTGLLWELKDFVAAIITAAARSIFPVPEGRDWMARDREQSGEDLLKMFYESIEFTKLRKFTR